jgi:hypothetical protein
VGAGAADDLARETGGKRRDQRREDDRDEY